MTNQFKQTTRKYRLALIHAGTYTPRQIYDLLRSYKLSPPVTNA